MFKLIRRFHLFCKW